MFRFFASLANAFIPESPYCPSDVTKLTYDQLKDWTRSTRARAWNVSGGTVRAKKSYRVLSLSEVPVDAYETCDWNSFNWINSEHKYLHLSSRVKWQAFNAIKYSLQSLIKRFSFSLIQFISHIFSHYFKEIIILFLISKLNNNSKKWKNLFN